MNKVLSVIARLALYLLGIGLFVGSLWLLVRYFGYGDNHPINALLGIFGIAPVMLNVADINWLSSSLLQIIVSVLTASMIYVSLADLALVLTQELALLIEVGGPKKYLTLQRAPKPGDGWKKMLFIPTVRLPK